MRLVSRGEALASNLKSYFTGKPCKHGHVAERQANNGTCFVCRSEIFTRFNDRHPGQQARFSNEYRKANPARAKKHAHDSYEKNKTKRLARNKEYRGKNRKKLYAKAKEYIAKNPDRIRSIKRNNRAKRALAEGVHFACDIQKIFKSQKGKCVCCLVDLKKIGYHVDHIFALARGGSNWPSNLQLLCPTCNIRKGARDATDFMREAGRLL